jgi:acetyltransferase-like isoleucine patch superfamily enzyme
MITSFYSQEELLSIGFSSVGNNVQISRKASIYGPENMSIGDNVRIDDFCILSGKITIRSNIHISAYVALYGAGGIIMEDYTGISPRSTIYSAMDDFSGNYLIGPIHPTDYTNVQKGQVVIKKYSQIGTHSVIFPDVTIGEGSVIGAMTLVNKSLSEWGIYIGQPARLLKKRNKGLLDVILKKY